jgi:hypothetical protein
MTMSLAALCMMLPQLARADRLKVAVIPGIAVNLDAARVDALSQDLADALVSRLEIEAIGGLEVRRQLPPDGIPPDCVATPACIADVAKRTGAAQLLFVVMVDTGSGGSIQIDSTWVDPATGKQASRSAIDLASVGDAKSRFAAAATQLLPDAPVRPEPTVSGGQLGAMSPEVPRHLTTPAKITAGATVVGLGIGIGFSIAARSKYNACDAAPLTCTEDRRASIRNTALIADLGYVVAIGAGVATAVMYMASRQEARLIVAPSAESVSVSIVGSF